MNLMDLLVDECADVGAELTDKKAALARVVEVAKRAPSLEAIDSAVLLKAFTERETMGTTAFGRGIAIPHCRLPMVTEFVVGIMSVPGGVAFDAMDEKPVQLFVFIVAPENESNEHIRVLSEISSVLRIPGVIEEMTSAHSQEALRESFLRHARGDVQPKGKRNRQLFHVFVASDELFRQILEVFVAADPDMLTVVDSRSSAEYLSKMPLFAGFWSDQNLETNRIIVAMIDKGLTNETIRRIESIAGRLDESRDVMVSVQDLFFCAGSVVNG